MSDQCTRLQSRGCYKILFNTLWGPFHPFIVIWVCQQLKVLWLSSVIWPHILLSLCVPVLHLLPGLLQRAVLAVVGLPGPGWVWRCKCPPSRQHCCHIIETLWLCFLFVSQASCSSSEGSWTTPECASWPTPPTRPSPAHGFSSFIRGRRQFTPAGGVTTGCDMKSVCQIR